MKISDFIRKIGIIIENIFAEDKELDQLIDISRSDIGTQKIFISKLKKSKWVFNDFKTLNLPPDLNIKIWAIFEYRQKYIKDILWQIKYKGNRRLANFLAKIIWPEIKNYCIKNTIDKPIIIPMPSSKRRRRERGYNQCQIIVEEIEKVARSEKSHLYFYFQYDLLLKFRETSRQAKLKRQGRLRNISEKENCFKINDIYNTTDYKSRISEQNIIILDDIITTGSTMVGAIKILKNLKPVNIVGLAIGH